MTQPRVLKWLFLTFLALALVEGMLTLSLASTTRQMNQEFNGLKTDTAGMMSRLKNLPMLGLGPGGVPGAVSGTGPGAGPGAGPGTGPGVALAPSPAPPTPGAGRSVPSPSASPKAASKPHGSVDGPGLPPAGSWDGPRPPSQSDEDLTEDPRSPDQFRSAPKKVSASQKQMATLLARLIVLGFEEEYHLTDAQAASLSRTFTNYKVRTLDLPALERLVDKALTAEQKAYLKREDLEVQSRRDTVLAMRDTDEYIMAGLAVSLMENLIKPAGDSGSP